ncbi:uncharacterized protein LOC114877909 [Osmia bicornis bicornis]|uniref:uncharacterized protein LOC114877909 n=1 Tax=Osmia bicornis bicornis TaxID=1437191 RepID=UPI0010F83F8D|nr:uncharacterized protein LOC114877909 [Osmia bicornis bicornis]
MQSIKWNLSNLPNSKEAAIVWARERSLLRQNKNCSTHRKPMKLYQTPQHGIGRFRCLVGRGRCKDFAATVDSFFEDIHLPLDKAIKLIYCFTRDFSYENTAHELCDFTSEQPVVISSATIAAWYPYCRELIIDQFSQIQLGKSKLGGISESGSPIVVQIDEAQFGPRKYNRSKNVEGHWVLGILDTVTNDCRMIILKNWEALIPLIKEHVASGSEIHTNCLGEYARLSEEGFVHKTVNHSTEFVASDGTRIRRRESTWRPAKDWMRGRGSFFDKDFADRLCEFLWRRFCRRNRIDMMESLMEAIRNRYIFK